jgi:hypothetical protein
MVNVIVTEISLKLEPATEDSFIYVASTDRPREFTLNRITELFGSERAHAIVD